MILERGDFVPDEKEKIYTGVRKTFWAREELHDEIRELIIALYHKGYETKSKVLDEVITLGIAELKKREGL